MVFRLICPSRFSRITNSGTSSTDGIFFESTRHSSRRRAASMSRLVLLFWIVWRGAAHAGLEAELARAPDGERVDGVLAPEVLVLGVHDPALLQPDVPAVRRRRPGGRRRSFRSR